MGDSGTDETKLRFIQLYMDGIPGYVVPIEKIGEAIQAEFEFIEEEGEGLELKLRLLTQDQVDKAPEFEGW